MSDIHILVGRGKNCTCSDCIVLYGGKCQSTGDNNLLDFLEGMVRSKLNKDISMSKIDNVIWQFKPYIVGYLNLKRKSDFDKCFYAFMPLIYLMTSKLTDKNNISRRANAYNLEYSYKRTRWYLWLDIVDNYKNITK